MSSLHRTNKYDDMIDLPHHVSKTHPPMDIMDRAAQFSPFAALTGYEAAAEETRRLTQPKIELDESEKELLDIRLHDLETQFSQRPEITITYFIPDTQKRGRRLSHLYRKHNQNRSHPAKPDSRKRRNHPHRKHI